MFICADRPTKKRNCPPHNFDSWDYNIERGNNSSQDPIGLWDPRTETSKEPHRWRPKSTNQIIHLLDFNLVRFPISFHDLDFESDEIVSEEICS